MLASVVFVPSAPLLVPELAGPGASDTVPVRVATLTAAAGLQSLADRWVAVGIHDTPEPEQGETACPSTGTFARYGVDVRVRLSDRAVRFADDPEMPLSMLIAGWLRGQTGAGEVTPLLVGAGVDTSECVRLGAELRARIDADVDPIGVLVVGDGATSLSPRAPGGGLVAAAVDLQAHVDAALAAGDVTALAALDPVLCARHGVSGRAPWQVIAGLCADDRVGVETLYAAAPFGVGYTVARWSVR